MSDPGQRTGRPPRLAEWDLVFLTYRLQQQATWTTVEVRELIQREVGIESAPDQVVRLWRERMGMPFGQPFPRDYRRPPDAEDRLKASLHQVVMTLPEKEIGKDDIALGCLDEASPQHRANPVRVWRVEASPVVDKNPTPVKSHTIGCDAIQGVRVQAFLANSKEDASVDFLNPVNAAKATANAIVIVLDKDRSHWAGKVTETAQELGIYLIQLPPYSPDLNPIESIGKSIKRIVSRECVDPLDEMKRKRADGWKTLSGSLGFARHWISEFLETESYYNDLCV
jgi:transposase